MTDNKHQQISQRDFSWESLPQEHTHTLVEHAIVVQAYNPRTQETEVERLHVQHQPGLQRKNLSQKIQCLVNLMMIEFLKIATFGIRYRWKRDPPPTFPIVLINTATKNNFKEQQVYFFLQLPGHSTSPRKANAGTQGRNLETGTETETVKEC